MIKYKQDDILKAFEENEIDVLLQQVNCYRPGGTGIHRLISLKYPEELRQETIYQNSKSKLSLVGTILPVEVMKGKFIVNMHTQYHVGGPQSFFKDDYDTFENRCIWLKESLSKVSDMFIDKKIGAPLIASGKAKDINKEHTSDLDYFKRYIENIFLETLNKCDVTIYYL